MVELVTVKSYPCILGLEGLTPRRGGPRAECGCCGTSSGWHKRGIYEVRRGNMIHEDVGSPRRWRWGHEVSAVVCIGTVVPQTIAKS